MFLRTADEVWPHFSFILSGYTTSILLKKGGQATVLHTCRLLPVTHVLCLNLYARFPRVGSETQVLLSVRLLVETS